MDKNGSQHDANNAIIVILFTDADNAFAMVNSDLNTLNMLENTHDTNMVIIETSILTEVIQKNVDYA